MYILLTYDVGEKRTAKVMKLCRRYLDHVQKSVFEGEITETKLNSLKKELEKVVETEKDSLRIYMLETPYYLKVTGFGKKRLIGNII